MILEATRQQHALESLQAPIISSHELQYAHAQIALLQQKNALQDRELDACMQQLELAALSLAAKPPPPVTATIPSSTTTVHPSPSTVGDVPDLVTILFTAAGLSKNAASNWSKSPAISPGSVPPHGTVDNSKAFAMGQDPSTGDNLAYRKHTRMDSLKVLEELCPTGIPLDCREALGERKLPDVLAAIPGSMY